MKQAAKSPDELMNWIAAGAKPPAKSQLAQVPEVTERLGSASEHKTMNTTPAPSSLAASDLFALSVNASQYSPPDKLMKTKKTPSKKPATKGQKPRRLAPVPGYAFYRRPVRQVDGSYTVMIETSKSYKPETRPMVYWKYRRGGYNPADDSYGRCATKEDAQRILDRHNVRMSEGADK